MTAAQRSHRIKARAAALGFDAVGITDLSPPPHAERLVRWLRDGFAGDMRYMHRQANRRLDPALIVKRATRAVMLARNYFVPDPPELGERTGAVAKYARGTDYHQALREPLEALACDIKAVGSSGAFAEYYVDGGPVPERELAQRAGLGWIGKNTMLIDPTRGSYFFLAAVLTNVDLEIDRPFESDRCGTCRLCLDACPTDAFIDERVLDSRRCISYLTIEYRGEIDRALAPLMGDWVFGCDICQDVCPWNEKFAQTVDDDALGQDGSMARPRLDDFFKMSERDFDERYGDTPFERPGLTGMRRNAQIALDNSDKGVQCPTQ